MKAKPLPLTVSQRQRGGSLIIVLLLMVIVGLVSVASLKGAVSGEKLTNNIRMSNLAQQYAELALRFCEGELTKETVDRVLTLRDIVDTSGVVGYAGELAVTWTGSGGVAESRTVVPENFVQSSDSSVQPGRRPECVVESKTVSGNLLYVITARGFSPAYAAHADGKTKQGSVVWLQSILSI